MVSISPMTSLKNLSCGLLIFSTGYPSGKMSHRYYTLRRDFHKSKKTCTRGLFVFYLWANVYSPLQRHDRKRCSSFVGAYKYTPAVWIPITRSSAISKYPRECLFSPPFPLLRTSPFREHLQKPIQLLRVFHIHQFESENIQLVNP